MTYPLLVSAQVAREEILGISEHGWGEWVRRKIVEPVPGTRLYAVAELNEAHKRAREVYARPDNTVRISEVQRKSKARRVSVGGDAADWGTERIKRALSGGATGEGR